MWVGSESHPYAVKPTSTIVAESIGAVPNTQAADWEFACKAGTEAMQAAIGFVGSGMARYALSIGMDTAQGRPGDALEYTAAAGGAAMLIGPATRPSPSSKVLFLRHRYARLLAPGSFELPFPRRPLHRRAGLLQAHHGRGRGADERPGHDAGRLPIRHLPPAQCQVPPCGWPRCWASRPEQIAPGLLSPRIGNTYAGSAVIGLTATLDVAQPGDRILLVSYGSGAGSDAFSLRVTERIDAVRDQALTTEAYINRRTEIDYATYTRYRDKLKMS